MLPGFVVSMWERSDRPTGSQVVECSPGRLSKNSLVYHIIFSHCINMTVVYNKEDSQQFPPGSSFTMCLLFDETNKVVHHIKLVSLSQKNITRSEQMDFLSSGIVGINFLSSSLILIAYRVTRSDLTSYQG